MLVFDFDGTLTDAEAEGLPYRQGYLADLATITGGDLDEILVLAERLEAEVLQNRHLHGWVNQGMVVAPATVDPYLRMMPVARGILDHYGAISSDEDRSRLLDGILYKYNYPKSAIHFRAGAAEFLAAHQSHDLWVVTNSGTGAVQNNVRALSADSDPAGSLDWLVDRVIGFAKKYVVDPEFGDLPESLAMPGLDRPVLLRRAKYLSILEGLRDRSGCDWSDVTVIGDIFELDLCLPLHCGARVGLMVNDFTPPYELEYLGAHPRAVLLHSLDEAADFLAS